MPRSAEMSATMVVITDGFVSVEKEAFTIVRESLGDANLFAFGVGSSVNRHLIEGLAHQGMGRPFVVEKGTEAEEAAKRFREYVESPVLTNVKVELDGFDAYDLEPAHIPDLFGERPLVIMGKYRGRPKGALRISGTHGQGTYSEALQVEEVGASDDLIALKYLWARDRITRLSDFAIVGETHEAEITRLGLEYHLMTAFTSFVAADTVVRNSDRKQVTVRQPLPMPQGVENDAIGGVLGQSLGGALAPDGGGIGGLGTRGYGYGGGGGGRGKSALSVHPEAAVTMGSLDKDVIARVIRKNLARVRYCYEKNLAKNPNLAGRISIRFVIGDDGAVTKAEVSSTSMNDKEVETCLESILKSLKFPKPSGGGTVIVTYPFNFSPG
jgi:Ca-activated chloride channel homolog